MDLKNMEKNVKFVDFAHFLKSCCLLKTLFNKGKDSKDRKDLKSHLTPIEVVSEYTCLSRLYCLNYYFNIHHKFSFFTSGETQRTEARSSFLGFQEQSPNCFSSPCLDSPQSGYCIFSRPLFIQHTFLL